MRNALVWRKICNWQQQMSVQFFHFLHGKITGSVMLQIDGRFLFIYSLETASLVNGPLVLYWSILLNNPRTIYISEQFNPGGHVRVPIFLFDQRNVKMATLDFFRQRIEPTFLLCEGEISPNREECFWATAAKKCLKSQVQNKQEFGRNRKKPDFESLSKYFKINRARGEWLKRGDVEITWHLGHENIQEAIIHPRKWHSDIKSGLYPISMRPGLTRTPNKTQDKNRHIFLRCDTLFTLRARCTWRGGCRPCSPWVPTWSC